ncbi:MAG: hypothetical protein A3I66_04500 [Burkholderiales bacterium RIFCSPLOWO2_02_FULL_57_36]|nr:MAG: hypothetical protein A3I66_04500 [Burkholderiales bacterium RIFCSPLOWO2_02_FULL_57_36]
MAVSTPAFCQQIKEFKNIESFIGSLRNASVRGSAEGDLMGRGRMDWAGIVASKEENDEEIVDIYILEKLGSGNYGLVEKSASRPAFGGTGNFGYEDITIQDKSVFVVFSYHWHSCAGNSTSQFKLTKNGWQLMGIESFETNAVDGSGIDINTSTNLLTSRAVIKKTNNGKSKVYRIKTAPKLLLLKNYSGEGTISIQEKTPIC